MKRSVDEDEDEQEVVAARPSHTDDASQSANDDKNKSSKTSARELGPPLTCFVSTSHRHWCESVRLAALLSNTCFHTLIVCNLTRSQALRGICIGRSAHPLTLLDFAVHLHVYVCMHAHIYCLFSMCRHVCTF